MRKRRNSISTLSFSIFAVVFSFLILFLPKTHADGMVIMPDPYRDRWNYGDEDSQQAYINYEDGVQKMLISIDLGTSVTNNAVWIFPVPAVPEKVTIDVLTEFPQLDGHDVMEEAKDSIKGIRRFLMFTQIYPTAFYGVTANMTGSVMVNDVSLGTGYASPESKRSDVVVHETLTKEGITTELLTAKTSTGLYSYLKNKGLTVDIDSIPAFDAYIGEDYCFVVSWIELYPGYSPTRYSTPTTDTAGSLGSPTMSPEEQASDEGVTDSELVDDFRMPNDRSIDIMPIPPRYPTPNRTRGIFVTFPTNKIFYPLIPTSVYDSKKVPATIRVLGYMTPKIFKDIMPFTDVNYYFDEYANLEKDFYRKASQNRADKIRYTKIELDAPSKLLTEDLWITPRAPFLVNLAHTFYRQGYIYFLILLPVLSILSGLLAGLFVFGKGVSLKNKILLGLSNCVTILGVIVGTLILRTKETSQEMHEVLKKLKEKKYVWKRRFGVLLFIFDLPFILVLSFVVLGYLLRLFTYPIYDYYGGYHTRPSLRNLSIPLPVLLPFVVLYVVRVLLHVKDEDKELFKQLKSKGYSKWTMSPVDKRKLLFVPVFSAIFMVLSAISCGLLILLV